MSRSDVTRGAARLPGPGSAPAGGAAIAGARFKIVSFNCSPLTRWAIRSLIEKQPDWEFAGEAAAVDEALEVTRQKSPDLAILGLDFVGGSGFSLLKDLRILRPTLRLVVYSAFDIAAYAEHCLRLGARGYVARTEPVDHLVAAVRRVLGGGIFLSSEKADEILQRVLVENEAAPHTAIARLSPGEFEVLHLIGVGKTNREMAQMLHRSVKTIETYRARVRSKLGAKSGAELTHLAFRYLADPLKSSPQSSHP